MANEIDTVLFVRLPKALKGTLEKRAKEHLTSLSAEVRAILQAAVSTPARR